MALDKDTLIKHRFWILLLVAVPIILLLILLVPASIGGKTDEQVKKIDGTKKSLDLNQPKNEKWMEGLAKKEAVVTQQQKAVWGKAWDAQAGLFTWPSDPDRNFDFLGKAYFGAPIDRVVCGRYAGKRFDLMQAREILKIVQPVLPGSPRPVVLLRNPNPIRTVAKFARVQPPAEEIWLAQEDLWVQRELLQVVRDANDSVAKFRILPNFAAAGVIGSALYQAIPPENYWPAASKGERRQRFYNPFWELDLTLTQNAKKEPVLKGSIKNVSRRKLSLGMQFDVQFTRERQESEAGVGQLFVDGEPVPAGKSAEIKETGSLAQAVGRTPGLYGVEQVFTWKTAPVKRLDALSLFHSSHRNASAALKPARQFAPSGDAAKPAESSPAPAAPGGDGGEGGASRLGGGPVTGGPGGAAANNRLTESGLVRDRYLHVTEQVRRMPVALTVTVDQNHIPNVIAAFSNSRLRMQVTQVHMVHVRGDSLRSPTEGTGGTRPEDGGGGILPPKGGSPRFPDGGFGDRGSGDGDGGPTFGRGGGGLPLGLGGQPGTGQPGSGSSLFTPTENEDEGNLVELTVYALASLYERYPPPATATAGNEPGKSPDSPRP